MTDGSTLPDEEEAKGKGKEEWGGGCNVSEEKITAAIKFTSGHGEASHSG